MTMKYKDLNLAKVRDDNGLDFAHYTYKRDQCCCCYGPKDLPKRYWKNHVIPKGNNYSYILFNNASNGDGAVRANDIIKPISYISWRFPVDKLTAVGMSLQEQFPDNYKVLIPCGVKPNLYSILIIDVLRSADYYTEQLSSGDYKPVINS